MVEPTPLDADVVKILVATDNHLVTSARPRDPHLVPFAPFIRFNQGKRPMPQDSMAMEANDTVEATQRCSA